MAVYSSQQHGAGCARGTAPRKSEWFVSTPIVAGTGTPQQAGQGGQRWAQITGTSREQEPQGGRNDHLLLWEGLGAGQQC